MESIAYQTNDILEVMEKESGVDITALKVDGGASMNNFLMQFQADIRNTNVLRPKCVETTALGAAYLAGTAVGYWKNTEDIRSNWSLSKTFSPCITDAVRDEQIMGWKRAVKCALGYCGSV